MKLRIKVGSETFIATLVDNKTAKAFKAMLPITVNMTEYAGNEKYYDLSKSLPTAAFSQGTIRNGDIMLFGSRTLVLFYKTFSTSYSYTRIGAIDNTSGLENALGLGMVTSFFMICYYSSVFIKELKALLLASLIGQFNIIICYLF